MSVSSNSVIQMYSIHLWTARKLMWFEYFRVFSARALLRGTSLGASFANRPRELVPRALPCSAWGFFLSSGFLLLLLVSRSSCLGVSFPPPGKYQSPPRFLPFPLPLGFLPPGFRLLLLVFLSLLLDFFFAFFFFSLPRLIPHTFMLFSLFLGFFFFAKGFFLSTWQLLPQ